MKPTHACNLACTYCYNEDERNKKMTLDTLRAVVDRTCEFVAENVKDRKVDFIWHGGEPMLMGVDFYREVMSYQSLHSHKIHISNVMQTNGLKVNEEWCEFFKEHNWQVSISLDGTKKSHDLTRIHRNGKGSFDSVYDAIQLVKKHKIPLGACLVLSKNNVDNLKEVYSFLKSEELNFNIIPMTYSGEAVNVMSDIGLSPEEYSSAWTELYDYWFYDEETVHCSDFVNKSAGILNKCGADCVAILDCSRSVISVDHNGDVYPCATMSPDPNWLYGNIADSDLITLFASDNANRARNRQSDNNCIHCRWRTNCNGGCMSRADKFFDSINVRDYYCPGLFRIYEHIAKRLSETKQANLEYTPASEQEMKYYSSENRVTKYQRIPIDLL
ncbi:MULTISPECIES: dynobactin maturation radical SAM/SPASM protein DynA [Vibrio harveyi group]|uniref:dynobactin maturation radical SAM/SPASM protein DynA n=1 Tax=Vibrio harveyi group TaxID=717610 RepID=UPI0021754CBB|nr:MULTISPECIES: dynobactin maturation radical SAM/SPASM protein DynA [Vibrio harveyi group]MDF4635223.1 dynobactin maturation radical SAM/SPASM protein DynA [Vibrio parahaemolyticus]MDG2619290.1 dynobactin maturation radical SAM/SPASM protein DynA [Vibrio parahaemolyticus]MDV5036892.1 dynobactin maturation radical SAM/SPASM protein DynA [Vibrio diabolicus]